MSTDGTLLAAGTTTGDVVLWRWSDGGVLQGAARAGVGYGLPTSPCVARGDRLVTASEGGQLQR